MSSFWLLALVWLAVSPGGHGDLAVTLKTHGGVVTSCTGSNVTLLEAPPGVTPFHVYVFRSGETVATTSVKAPGLMKDRLFVRGNGSVLLTNVTSEDFGKYRMEIKVTESDSNPLKHDIRLVVAEPPRTVDEKLFVQQEPRGGTSVRVKCGVFESLGYPPVSAKWRDPSGQFLASQGFEDSFFYLDLPLTTSLSGTYCCQLHCPEPDHCCLQEASALRRCTEVDVTTNRSPDSGCDVTDSTRNDLRALEQRAWALTDRLQSLQDAQAREEANQSLGSAVAQLVHLQVKDQLEAHWARLQEWGVGQTDLETGDNLTSLSPLSYCNKRELQQRVNELELRFEQRLSDVAQQTADNLTDMQRNVADLRRMGAVQVSELELRLNQTLGDLEDTLHVDIASVKQSMGDNKRELQHRLDELEADMASLNRSMVGFLPILSLTELGLKTCRDLLPSTTKSGVYTLRPDGFYTYPVYCDLTTPGGGWLVFQRRQDGSVNVYRDWADYEDGLGDILTEFWLGLKKLHAITSARRHKLRVDLRDHMGERKYAEYENFRVESNRENYRLTVSGYSGTAGDSLDYHNGMSFSTRDRDNDRSNTISCAQEWKGAWWHQSCHNSNLNGLYKASGEQGGDGIVWFHFRQDRTSLTLTEMKIQPV